MYLGIFGNQFPGHQGFGVKEEVKGTYDGTFAYLSTTGEDLTAIEKKWLCVKELTAPVQEGFSIQIVE